MVHNNKITILNDKKEKKEYLILSKFNITNKSEQYILFTDKSFDENNNMIIYSGILDDGKIRKIEDEDDIKIIDNYLKQFEEAIRKNN